MNLAVQSRPLLLINSFLDETFNIPSAVEMDAKIRERTNAKRSLTRAQNLVFSILDGDDDVDIVKNRFSEVLTLREKCSNETRGVSG